AADGVTVATPSGAVGLEAEIVVVAGLQDGAWPDLRPRGSLLHADALVEVLSGLAGTPIDERRRVLDDELRMFALALSRARRQVVVTALESEDESPSPFLDLLPPLPRIEAPEGASPLDLRGMVGVLRRQLTAPEAGPEERDAAASGLAGLAAAAVPGADPAEWLGLGGPSTTEPLFTPDEDVPLSPSHLESLETSTLDWFIDDISADPPGLAAGVGTLLHWAMQEAARPDLDAVWQVVLERWGELSFEAPWLERRERAAARRLAAGLAEYLADARRAGRVRLAAEQRFTLRVGRATMNGSVDRLEKTADGRVVIVDLKTGRPVTSAEAIAAHPQLSAYQAAYRDGRFDEVLTPFGPHRLGGASLLFVRDGIGGKLYRDEAQDAIDEVGLRAFRSRVENAARLLTATALPGPRTIDDRHAASAVERLFRRIAEVTHG
ncbi:MAG TPA: PD-(D/E)XK nuclease family protein, partial [Microbacteriaceae bacterium]|nr:PD-(D/E)XK nuclease family protein [Microbacteriaceae bacterium]